MIDCNLDKFEIPRSQKRIGVVLHVNSSLPRRQNIPRPTTASLTLDLFQMILSPLMDGSRPPSDLAAAAEVSCSIYIATVSGKVTQNVDPNCAHCCLDKGGIGNTV